MPTRELDGFLIEFTGELLEGSEQWAAYVSISSASSNPMHLNNIGPKRRVSPELAFASQQEAEAQAERAAPDVLNKLRT